MFFKDPLDLLFPILRRSEHTGQDGNRIGPGRPSLRKNYPGGRSREKGWRNDKQAAERYRRRMEREQGDEK